MDGPASTSGDRGWAIVGDDGLVLFVNLSEEQATEAAAAQSLHFGDLRHAVPIAVATRMGRTRQRLHDATMAELRKRQRLAAQRELDLHREQQAIERAQELRSR